MNDTDLLKKGRDLLLSLHKRLVDSERVAYEGAHGKVTSGQFLNALLEDPELAWLRRFSALIVDIDELFAQKDGYDEADVKLHLNKLRELVSMSGAGDEDFNALYSRGLQEDLEAAAIQGDLKRLLA